MSELKTTERRCNVRIGSQPDDVVVEVDGVDLVKRSYLAGLDIVVTAYEPAELTIHIVQPSMSAEDIRWTIPEEELRWLADAHGFELVQRERLTGEAIVPADGDSRP